MKKIVFSLFFLASLGFGTSGSSGFKPDETAKQNSDFFNPSFTKNTDEKKIADDFTPKIKSKYIFPSFSEDSLQKSAYLNQLIPLKIKATTAVDFQSIKISSTNEEIGSIYPSNTIWKKLDDNSYEGIVYFQAKTQTSTIPSLKVEFLGQEEQADLAYLPSQKIDIIDLKDDDGKFINLFAKGLHVKNFKTNRFDEDSLIMVIEFNAKEANTNDIHFNNFQRQGIDSKKGTISDETIFYFLIFKDGLHHVDFSYFNLIKNNFETIKLPVTVSENELSTHIGLNPKKSVFELYKEVGLGVLALLFFTIFLFRRRYFYLLVALVCTGILAYKKVSFTDIMLKDSTKVRILPTEKSTIFFTTQNPTEAEKLNTVKHYIKVLLPNGKIGWVKEDDIIKN